MILSICIATKDRSEKIIKSIKILVDIYSKYKKHKKIYIDKLEICIADSSSTNLTEKFIQNYSKNKSTEINFVYERVAAEGIDKGFNASVKFSSGDFIWLLSDDDLVNENTFKSLDKVFSKDITNNDLFILNGTMKDSYNKFILKKSRIPISSKSTFSWSNSSLEERLNIFGYMCLISCIIFKREIWFKGQERTFFDIREKYFSHITILMNGLNNKSKIKIVYENIISITQGPQSWIDKYSYVYKNAYNECLLNIKEYGTSMYAIKSKKDHYPNFSMFMRSFIYSSNYPLFLRKYISFFIGIILFYFSKLNIFSRFKLVSYEFLSYAHTLLPIIFWRKKYKIILFDSRHSHRLTGIGKFQTNLLSNLQSKLNSKPIFIVTKRYGTKTPKNNEKNSLVLYIACSNYIFSELFQLPILNLIIKPNIFLISANTAPFIISKIKNSKIIRIIHDTIFIDNLIYLFKNKLFGKINLRKFFTELYMSINLLVTAKNKCICNYCISEYSKNSALKFKIKVSEKILPTFYSSRKNKINFFKKHNLEIETWKIILFIADDPRKSTIAALEAYLKYIKNKISSSILIRELYLVGKIKDKNLKNKVELLTEEIGLYGIKVNNLGFIDEDKLKELLLKSHFLLYPSQEEGFGIPICEAWENDVIPIASNCGAIREFPDNGLVRIKLNTAKGIAKSLFEAEKLSYQDKICILKNGKNELNNIKKKQASFLNYISDLLEV